MNAEFSASPSADQAVDPNQYLAYLREQVDGVDGQIMSLVERRVALMGAIDAEKASRGMSTIVADRSTEAVGTYIGAIEEDGPLKAGDGATIASAVMRVMGDVRRRQASAAKEEPGARLQREAEAVGETVL